jgi:hypothetical protein
MTSTLPRRFAADTPHRHQHPPRAAAPPVTTSAVPQRTAAI